MTATKSKAKAKSKPADPLAALERRLRARLRKTELRLDRLVTSIAASTGRHPEHAER
jgi:hypothetical protein